MRDLKTGAAWRDLGCGQRAADVARDLQVEYVLPGHQFGPGCACSLESRFAPLREWLYAAESLEGWRSRPQFKALGELLLRELRIEFLCAQGGFSREEFRMHMQLESEDPLDRAVAKLWLERRGFDGGCSSGTGGGVRGRKRRIPPAVRRRRKRDQRQSMPPTTVSPPQSSDGPLPRSHVRYHDPQAAPVQARCARLVPLLPARCTAPRGDASGDDTLQLPPQSIGNPPHSINFAGVSLVGHHPGTARSPDSRESHSSPIAGEPPAQRLGAGSDPQSDAARDPAGATTPTGRPLYTAYFSTGEGANPVRNPV